MTDQKKARGFAAMSPERLREVSSRGGKGTPKERRAFHLKPELASKAGKIGGKMRAAEDRAFADPDFAREAGRKGSYKAIREKAK